MLTPPGSLALLTGLVLGLGACASGGGADREHVEAMAREHAHDAPVANAAAAEPAQDVVARAVTYAGEGGRPVEGYLAEPLKADAGTPGLIVIHEWWGLNDNVRMMTRRLAGRATARWRWTSTGARRRRRPSGRGS